MPLNISFKPIPVLIDGHDTDGNLILSESHEPENKGLWNLEAGFGKCAVRYAPLFKTPEEAGAWVEQTLTSTL
jgi:hypothetical protein